jgi:hypothetical protein
MAKMYGSWNKGGYPDEKPHAILPSHHQQRFSSISGSVFVMQIYSDPKYKAFLESNMSDFLADVPLIIPRELRFMYDADSARFCRYPGRWIGRGGPTACPLRSPHLNPLDSYLWDHLKLLVCSCAVDDVGSFRSSILDPRTLRIMQGIWDRLQVAMRHRAEACVQAAGGHVEHLLHVR